MLTLAWAASSPSNTHGGGDSSPAGEVVEVVGLDPEEVLETG